MDPITGSPAKGRKIEGIVTIHVDDAFMCGSPQFKKLVIGGLKKDFQVGSEDINDCMFVGSRVQWKNRGLKDAHIVVEQERKVEELESITFDSTLKEDSLCSFDLHRQYRSVLGQINWLQSRTQFQACYLFSRAASALRRRR